MKKFFLFISLVFLFFQNCSSQVSMNMNLLDNWDQSGLSYNDVWGYVDGSGNEYAILGSRSKIHFFEITASNTLSLIDEFTPGATSTWRDFKTYGDYAYACTEGNEGLLVYDLSNLPTSVTLAHQITSEFTRAHNIYIDEAAGKLYVVGSNTQSNGLIIYDVTTNPATHLASVPLPGGGYVHDIYVRNDTAYASHGWNGFYIWDVSTPSSPNFLASYTGESGYNHSSWVTPDGNTAFYAREVGTGLPMTALDISDYNNLGVISNFQFPLLEPAHTDNTPHNPYLVGDYLFTSYYEDGIEVFDVSDPANVTLAAYYDTYPSNTQYNGYNGCWGTYPFLPSGKILGSDGVNGLFLLETNFPLVPPLVLNLVSQTNVSCNGGNEGWLEVTGADGTPPYTYTLDGGTPQSSGIFLNLSAGAYIVEVTDAANEVVSITVTITQPDQITPIITQQQNVDCFGGTNGFILASAVGGTVSTNYLYSIDGINFSPNNTFANLTGGTYALTVRDDNNCEASLPFIISEPDLLQSFVNSQTDVDCFGNNSGAIDFNTVGGTQNYLYSLDQVDYQASNSFSNLLAGSYTLFTLDVNNCESQTPFTISQPTLLEISLGQQTNVNCFGDSDGEVVLNGQGGTGNYQYNIDGGNYQTSSTFSNLSAGSYDFNIKDGNDCITSLNVTITSPPEILVQFPEINHVDCFGGNTGSITLQLSGGAGNFSTTMNGSTVTGSTVVFQNLTAGTYPVLVEDGNNCTSIESVTINENSEVQLSLVNSQDVTCNGNADGSIEVNVTGGNGGYTFSINGSSNGNNNTFTNLSAGQHIISTIDDLGCEDVMTVNIIEPSLIQVNLISQTNESCSGANDGSVTFEAIGGVGNFQYNLNATTNSTGIFTNLPAGNYNVIILDGNSCIENQPFVIESVNPIAAQIDTQSDIDCFGNNNGSIQVSASGGNSNFTFDLGSQSNSTGLFQNLTAGNYTISITDGNNCQTTIGATISQPSEILPSLANSQQVLCFGENNGSFQIQANGGTGSYNFAMGNETNTTGFFENLTAGNYTISITDENNCLSTFATIVSQPDVITSSISASQNVDCFGENNGNLQVQANGGTGNFNFTLGSETNSTGFFQNLTAGNYNIAITDANNCSTSTSFEITQPTELTISTTNVNFASCNGQEGSIQVTSQGGTGNYQFSNGNTTNSTGLFENLAAGIYMISVTDGNDCMTSIDVDIMEPNALNVEVTQTQNPLCNGENSGSVQLQAMGGTGTINYTLGTETNTTGVFQNLIASTYNITVTDDNDCTSLVEVELTEPAVLEITNNQTTNVNCFGENNGSVNLGASGGNGTLIFSLGNESNTSGNFENLAANIYTISVEDENGCNTSMEINITEPTVLTSEVLQTNPIDCAGENNGMIQFEANGGNGNYEFNLAGTTNSTGLFENLPADDYMMNLTDGNGCNTSQNVTLTEPLAITSNILAEQNVLCHGENTGSVSISAGGGTGQFEFSIGNETNTTGTFENLSAGNYNIIITDENNCQNSIEVTIEEPSPVEIEILQTQNLLCANDESGSIEVNATGGSGTHLFQLNGMSNSTGVFENLTAGTYDILVTDANNCSNTLTVEIDEPQPLEVIFTQGQNVLCNGDNTGLLDLGATGGTGDIAFTLGNETNQTGLFENLEAGVYEVTLSDNNMCTTSAEFEITEPAETNLTIENSQPVSCFGESDGSISVIASGGNGNFTYTLGNETNTTGVFDNLPAGTDYNIIFTDENNCSNSLTTSILEPAPISSNIDFTNSIQCFGETGTIAINGSGGTGDLEYTLGNETNTTGIFENLPAGVYNVSMVDQNNCSEIVEFEIDEPQQISTSISQAQNILCAGESSGNFEINATGGTGTLTFILNGNSNTTGIFENLNAGTFEVTILDENDCETIEMITLTEPDELTMMLENTQMADCAGATTGGFEVQASGGMGNYTYSIDNQTNSDGIFEDLASGIYDCLVTDENDCTSSISVTINENNDIELNEFNNANVECFGDENGSISISVSGGTGDFTFSLGSETNSTGLFPNLPAGIYNVTATDLNDCSAIFSAEITEPNVLEMTTDEIINVACFGESTGSIQLSANGGTGVLDFSVEGNSNSTGLFENLPAGNYEAIVNDENNCNNTVAFEITEAPELILSVFDQTNDTGNGNGSVTFEGTGGTPTYLFSLDGLDYQAGTTFPLLSAGNYIGYIQDANGCIIEIPFEIILETSISNPDLGVLEMNVFPNPFSEKITVQMDLAFAQTIQLEMINISGQSILLSTTKVENGKQNITLDVNNNIPAGIYFLSVKNEDQAIGYFKIIKQ